MHTSLISLDRRTREINAIQIPVWQEIQKESQSTTLNGGTEFDHLITLNNHTVIRTPTGDKELLDRIRVIEGIFM